MESIVKNPEDKNRTPNAKEALFREDVFKIESKIKRKSFDYGQ